MALTARFLVVLLAFLAACIAAETAFISAFLAYESGLVPAVMANPTLLTALAGPLGFGFMLVSGTAVLPAIFVVTITEVFGLRAVWVYAIAGAAVGFVSYLIVVPLEHEAVINAHAPGIIGPYPKLIVGAGIAAGAVYWGIAGRSAGAWRKVKRTSPAN